MRRCVRADLRALRKLERHNTWLQQNIPSRSIQQQRQRAVFELRSDLCLKLRCCGSDIEAVLDQQLD
jgi:predicted DNA binding CopG/RHH family protein